MGGRDLFEHVDSRLMSTQTAVDRGYAKEDRDEVDRIPDKVRAGLVEAAVRLDRSASLDKGDRGALRLRCSIRVAQRCREIACRIPPEEDVQTGQRGMPIGERWVRLDGALELAAHALLHQHLAPQPRTNK